MLGEALRLVRVYHDLSQSQLCTELGVSNSYVSEIESGKKQPTLELLQKYSAEFGIPVSSLMFFAENLDDPKPTDKLRKMAASQVISLLQWVENKNARKRIGEASSKKRS
ncbi:helix-turn-helix domain-containing protein [Burkholderia contaminans]|uniref:XRE family transcriptional regulator n=1 Tax=Burkholderia contaminans TaxID=488447 RepID=A0A3N8QZB4_9BURK|nr:helix-turn-helix transcriptional regulator [Burkholderia contaminans]RQT29117.1 XRE family transcriptional regulator [Burkholderia contaminans]